MDPVWIEQSQQIIGYEFKDASLLKQALSHSSAVDQREESNERLEFLGDAVLGFVICHETFMRFPDFEEGDMTKVKSAVVSRRVCAEIAETLELHRILQVGKGMEGSELPSSVTGAAYEAIIGAIYIDNGFDTAREFVLKTVGARIDEAASSTHQDNYKSVLQQVGQKMSGTTPLYIVLDEKGPDHAKCFEIAVDLDGNLHPAKWGASKKQAEQLAALAALIALGIAVKNDDGTIEISELQGE
jgi:ribonuclease-3